MLGEMVETKQVFNLVEQHLTLCGADAFHLQQQFSQAASKFDEQAGRGWGSTENYSWPVLNEPEEQCFTMNIGA